ncbi:reverse transcriptase [Plasmodiophora brassicae]
MMHKEVAEGTEAERSNRRQKTSESRLKINFGLGDYVLISKELVRAGEKLFLKWKGPYQIINAERGYVFEVKNLVNGDTRIVHGSRMRLYADSNLNLTEELKAQIAYDNSTWEIDGISDARVNNSNQTVELLVRWRGFSDDEALWEPAQVIIEDAPSMVKEFISENPQHALVEQLANMLGDEKQAKNTKRRRGANGQRRRS